MSSQLVAAMPCSPCSSRVDSTIRCRVRATAAVRLLMSYFRGDICLTNILRLIIVAASDQPPPGGTHGDRAVNDYPVPYRPRPAALVLRDVGPGQGLGRRHGRPVHP